VATPDVSDHGSVPSTRERIVRTAYELFTRRGIRAVGMDEVIARAAVAKATLYRHFPTKDDLVLAVLQRREQLWTYELLEAQSRKRGNTPEEQLLAIFDVLHEWFQQHEDYDGCSFIKVLLEMGAAHPAGQASIAYMANFRTIIRQRALAAGLLNTDEFARSFHILTKGAIISASEGDPEAARHAQSMARLLIEQHRPPTPSPNLEKQDTLCGG
jgi:AcrR family transcriptional regulator